MAVLADSIGTSVIRIENTLNELIGEGIDDKLAAYFIDQECKNEYIQSAKTIRRAYRKLANLI